MGIFGALGLTVIIMVVFWVWVRNFAIPRSAEIERRGAKRFSMAMMRVIERHRWIKNAHVPEIWEEYYHLESGDDSPVVIKEDYDGSQSKPTEDELP